MHTLIVGAPGVGKSTLIRRVLQTLDRPVFGFETKKEDAFADAVNGSPVYIYDAGGPYVQRAENLVGYCKARHTHPIREGFDRYAPKLRRPVPDDTIIQLDEIGTMESSSTEFCSAILALLDGDIPVIAAVKEKDTPFLNAVRQHKNCRCFYITEENRDALYEDVMAFFAHSGFHIG